MRCSKCGYETESRQSVCNSCLVFLEEKRRKNEEMYRILRIISFFHPVISLFFAAYHASFNRNRYAERHISISFVSMLIYLTLFLIYKALTL